MPKDEINTNLLVVSGYPPNLTNGGGIILCSLLSELSKNNLSIITNENFLEKIKVSPNNKLLEVKHTGVKPLKMKVKGLSRFFRFLNFIKIFTATYLIKKNIRKDTVILVIPWSGELASELTVAVYFANKLWKVPFLVYEMDDWKANIERAGLIAKVSERYFHEKLLKNAYKIYVISHKMADDFFYRYGVSSHVLPHCVDIQKYNHSFKKESQSRYYMYYTGAVYGAQIDSIKNIISAIEEVNDIDISLVIFTNQTKTDLEDLGVLSKKVCVKEAVPVKQIPSLLMKADILLLPFSFRSEEVHVVSSSYPTKTADYLASGVPILVHAPHYSTIAQEASGDGWGLVVDQPNIDGLKDSIRLLISNADLRDQLSERARSVASEKHDIKRCRTEFFASIDKATKLYEN